LYLPSQAVINDHDVSGLGLAVYRRSLDVFSTVVSYAGFKKYITDASSGPSLDSKEKPMSIRRRLFQMMSIMIALLGLAFGAVGHASAATGAYTITASHTGFALDVEGASTADGARIVQWPLNPLYVPGNELWRFSAVPGAPDTYYIQSASNGKVLSVNSYAAGAPVIQWTNQGAATQQWYEVRQGGTARKYRNVATGLYLDVSGNSYNAGAPLVQWYQTNGANQVFNVSYWPF
jgi:hypothetical protein